MLFTVSIFTHASDAKYVFGTLHKIKSNARFARIFLNILEAIFERDKDDVEVLH